MDPGSASSPGEVRMKKIIDNNGRAWKLSLNIGIAKKIKDEFGLDLCSLIGLSDITQSTLSRMMIDSMLLIDVIYFMVQDQAEVDADDFGGSFAGDSIGKARDAFFEELVNFYPSLQERKILAEQIQRTRMAVTEMASLFLEAMSESELKEQIRGLFGNLYSVLRDDAESTPVPSHSEN